MGWWRSSSANSQSTSQQRDHASDPPPPPFPESTPSELEEPKIPPPLTRDEQAELDFKSFLEQLEEEENGKHSIVSKLPPNPFQTPANSSSKEQSTPPNRSIAPESLQPTTMSCRDAFDYAFFCQSVGGQWVNVYRYGELRSCSEHWGNFWLCMRSRSYKGPEKEKMIRDHHRKKHIKYKTGPSSEDVWELRSEPIEGAFEGDFLALEKDMKEREEAEKARNES